MLSLFLAGQVCFQGLYGRVCIASLFVQQGHEAAAHDGTRSMGTCCFEGLPVADAEAYHPRVAEVHGVYLLEIRLFGSIEVFLCPGGCRTGHHVDKSVRMGVYLADALLARLGRNEHNDFYPVLFGQCPVVLFVFQERQVGDDDPVDAAPHALLTEMFEAELQDGVQVAHQHEGDMHVASDIGQLAEEQAKGHAVVQGAGGGFLYDHPVGHGVAEGYAYFYHSHAVALEGADNVGCPVQGRAAGAEVNGKQILGIAFKELVDTVLHCDVFFVKFLSLFFQFSKKPAEPFHIFHSGRDLEATVQVHACQVGMAEGAYGLCTIGIDASTEQEGGLSVVVPE